MSPSIIGSPQLPPTPERWPRPATRRQALPIYPPPNLQAIPDSSARAVHRPLLPGPDAGPAFLVTPRSIPGALGWKLSTRARTTIPPIGFRPSVAAPWTATQTGSRDRKGRDLQHIHVRDCGSDLPLIP